jgi:two-component system response regulator YesN
MRKAVICDDERIEREGLKYLIEKHGFELEVHDFADGEEARDYIRLYGADILLTDIRMPFLNGLELIEDVRSKNPDMRFIIFSAYDDFEYARAAIDLDVTHYLLKPVDEAEFCEVLRRAMSAPRSRRRRRSAPACDTVAYRNAMRLSAGHVIYSILKGQSVSRQYRDIMHEAGIEIGADLLSVCVVEFDRPADEHRDGRIRRSFESRLAYAFTYIPVGDYRALIVVQPRRVPSPQARRALGEGLLRDLGAEGDSPYCIVMSPAVRTVHELRSQYAGVERVLERKFFLHAGQVVLADEFDIAGGAETGLTEDVLRILDTPLDRASTREVREAVIGLFRHVRPCRGCEATPAALKYVCSHLARRVAELSVVSLGMSGKELIDEIYQAPTVDRLEGLMRGIVEQLQEEEETSAPSLPPAVARAVQVVHERYTENVGVEQIAVQLELNPSYLSHTFKQHIGIGLTKYICQVRLRKAEGLLRNSNMRVSEIAREVGINSSSYFSMLFKDHWGMSPVEFRRRGALQRETL